MTFRKTWKIYKHDLRNPRYMDELISEWRVKTIALNVLEDLQRQEKENVEYYLVFN